MTALEILSGELAADEQQCQARSIENHTVAVLSLRSFGVALFYQLRRQTEEVEDPCVGRRRVLRHGGDCIRRGAVL